MSDTFETAWRSARVELPAVPALLVRSWATEAFRKLCDSWGWSFLRAEGTIVTNANRPNLTVGVTNGSATVTSAGLFTSADVGRNFRVNRLPVYTVQTLVSANSITLDRAYTEDTNAAATGTIYDAYFTAPADFRRFIVIYDRYYLRIIPFWLSEDEVAVADPGRVISDLGPRYLVARSYSVATATAGQVQYEYWPAPTAFRTYPYLYYKRTTTITDSTILPGVLSERADLIRTYCLWRGATWPGTVDEPNPAYRPQTAPEFKRTWDEELNRLQLIDDAEYPQQLTTTHWERRVGAIAPTASLLRQTDATVNDYY